MSTNEPHQPHETHETLRNTPTGWDDHDDEAEVPLLGGDVTEGVVRVGDTVRRPQGPQSPLVHTVLAHLERVGFEGAPRFLGVDGRDREVLSWVAGEVAGRPWPAWTRHEDRVVSVARLVRGLDDALEALGVPDGIPARVEPAGTPPLLDVGSPTLVGHLDVTPENVVFRNGRAHALIDFDLVRPATRVQEVSNVLLWWAPLMPPDDRETVLRDVDATRRARLVVDAYGLSEAERELLIPLSLNLAERTWHLMHDRSKRLGGGWQRMWDEGIGDRITRRRQWLEDEQGAFMAALRTSTG